MQPIEQVEELFAGAAQTTGVVWIEVNGLHDVESIEKIGHHFAIHPLVLEDILDTTQRPKFQEFDEYLFMVLRVPRLVKHASKEPTGKKKQTTDFQGESKENITFEQVSWLVGKDWLVSFSENDKDLFEPVRARILSGKGRIRSQGTDYLAYALLDLAIDHFFSVLDEMGDVLNYLDEALVLRPGPPQLKQIHFFKRQLLYLHKAVWPVREIIGTFERCESNLCNAGTRPYLRDSYDHIIQVIDMVETYRDLVAGMLDIYLSSISYRLNEVMKVLTIISTFFIPLTFIAGVYGMNFESMPGLRWEYGFYAVSSLMLLIALIMIKFFRIKKWL
jgi:magnesium transporter